MLLKFMLNVEVNVVKLDVAVVDIDIEVVHVVEVHVELIVFYCVVSGPINDLL